MSFPYAEKRDARMFSRCWMTERQGKSGTVGKVPENSGTGGKVFPSSNHHTRTFVPSERLLCMMEREDANLRRYWGLS